MWGNNLNLLNVKKFSVLKDLFLNAFTQSCFDIIVESVTLRSHVCPQQHLLQTNILLSDMMEVQLHRGLAVYYIRKSCNFEFVALSLAKYCKKTGVFFQIDCIQLEIVVVCCILVT